MRLELRDAPGQLEKVLATVARFGGNIRTVAHERDAAHSGVVPVRIVCDLPDASETRLLEALREEWVILSVSGVDSHRRFAVLLLGHVFQADIKALTDSVFACGAEVRALRAEIRGEEQPSAALIEAVAPTPALAAEAERRLCAAASVRGLTAVPALDDSPETRPSPAPRGRALTAQARGAQSGARARPWPPRVILAGYGSVGKAFHAQAVERGIPVVAVVRQDGIHAHPKGPGDLGPAAKGGVLDALGSVEADVLVELTPTDLKTGEPGLSHVREALSKGMDVVTANKGPLVADARGLLALAAKSGGRLRFDGTVQGAVPSIALFDRTLAGNDVVRLDGILNGTANHILTRMAEEGLDYDVALHEAQELGYAEADPTYDVDGVDAAAKLVILANHVFGLDLKLDDVRRSGIRMVTPSAHAVAAREGYVLRLIASVDASGHAEVGLRLVPKASDLDVGGVRNVLRWTTAKAGAFTVVGRGAGGPETATAVMSDLLSLAP